MTKMNMRPPRFNPDYPGFIVPEVMCKTQMEIIDMVDNGTFKQTNQDRASCTKAEEVRK